MTPHSFSNTRQILHACTYPTQTFPSALIMDCLGSVIRLPVIDLCAACSRLITPPFRYGMLPHHTAGALRWLATPCLLCWLIFFGLLAFVIPNSPKLYTELHGETLTQNKTKYSTPKRYTIVFLTQTISRLSLGNGISGYNSVSSSYLRASYIS